MKKEPKSVAVTEEPEAPRLTAAQYWEWRNSITELWLAQSKEREAYQKHATVEKGVEIANLRVQLAGRDCKDAKTATSEARSNYFKLKGVLEESLGISLDNKAIDDLTFEVREAPADKVQES